MASAQIKRSNGLSGGPHFYRIHKPRLVTDQSPTGYVEINNLYLAALLDHIQIFVPWMQTLDHISTVIDNATAQGWANQGSARSATAVMPILWNLSLLTRQRNIYASIRRMKGEDNNMDDATLRLTHLSDQLSLCHFNLNFPLKILDGCSNFCQSADRSWLPYCTASDQTKILEKKSHKDTTTWRQRRKFYGWMHPPPDLQGTMDPINFF